MKFKVGLLGGGFWGIIVVFFIVKNIFIKIWVKNVKMVDEINKYYCNEKYLFGVKFIELLVVIYFLKEVV